MSLSRRDLLTASALLLAGPGGALRAAGKEAARGETPLVLCWNENPYGPSPAARLAVSRAIAQGCRYPADAEIQELVEALAGHERIGADCIVTGTGSGELLCALGLLCGRDGGEIIAAAPTYAELPDYARLRGATLKFVPVDAGLRHDLPAMRAAVSERTRAIYICNPNNPTGTVVGASELRAFVAALPERLITIVDEAYMDFTVGADVASVADLVGTSHRVVVLRTFSKIHGMAGLRCGYAIARPDLACFSRRLPPADPGEPHPHHHRVGAPRAAVRRAAGQFRVLRHGNAAGAFHRAHARAQHSRRPALSTVRDLVPDHDRHRARGVCVPRRAARRQGELSAAAGSSSRLMQVRAASALCSSLTSTARVTIPAASSARCVHG